MPENDASSAGGRGEKHWLDSPFGLWEYGSF
jgi:hypothetical protein